MKNTGTRTVLNWLLAASVLLSLLFCYQFFKLTRDFRSLQRQVIAYQNNLPVLNQLVNDAMEYSKRDPAIGPILESVGVPKAAKPNSTGATKPATK